MIEAAHSYHHPYKPKQRFTHYIKTPDLHNVCNDIETTCRNIEADQPTPTAVIHHHYLSQPTSNLIETTYKHDTKEDFRLPSSSSSSSSAAIVLPSTQLHDMILSKSLTPPVAIKAEPNLERKQFSDNSNNSMMSLMKATNGKNPTSMTVNVPCLVCGDEASGFHYGVNSCEGCKVIFL